MLGPGRLGCCEYLVQDGDIIELDVESRKRHLAVDDIDLDRRRKSWEPAKTPPGGYARLYHDHVMQANLGADLDFLQGCHGNAVGRPSH